MALPSHLALRPPSFLLRTAALFIDFALFLTLYLPLEFLLVGSVRREVVWTSVYAGSALLLLYGLSEIAFAATPGKLLLRLRIKSADGSPAPSNLLALRYLIKFSPRILGLLGALLLSSTVKQFIAWLGLTPWRERPLELITLRTVGELALLTLIAGYFMTLSQSRRTLHDRLSGTAIYRLPRKAHRLAFEPILTEINPGQPAPVEAPLNARWTGREHAFVDDAK